MAYEWPDNRNRKRAARLFGPIFLAWQRTDYNPARTNTVLCETIGITVKVFRKYSWGQGLPNPESMEKIIQFYSKGDTDRKEALYDELVTAGIITKCGDVLSIAADPRDPAPMQELRLAGKGLTAGTRAEPSRTTSDTVGVVRSAVSRANYGD
jgi:hypothetical protein